MSEYTSIFDRSTPKSSAQFKRWRSYNSGYKDSMSFYTPNNKMFGDPHGYRAPDSPFDKPGWHMMGGSGVEGQKSDAAKTAHGNYGADPLIGANNFNSSQDIISSNNPFKNGTMGGGKVGVFPGETPQMGRSSPFGNFWKPSVPIGPGQAGIL